MLEKLSEFDISKLHTSLILGIILVGYVGVTTYFEMWTPECQGLEECFDYDRRMARLAVWDFDWIKTDLRHTLHMGLLVISYQLFGSYTVLVLASSVLLLVVTYLFTTILSGKRFGGLVAVIVVLQSSIFYNYDTSVTYPSFWALLFLTSLYLLHTKKWALSPLPFIASIPAKSLTALFIPGVLAWCWFEKRKKMFYVYIVLTIIGFGLIFSSDQFSQRDRGGFSLITHFDPEMVLEGFVSWMWKGFGSDQSTLLLLVVFIFLLFLNRKKIEHSNAVLSMTVTMIFISPVLIGMTTYDVWPYRMLPLVVMIGVMVGMVIANLDKINLKMFLSKA